MNSWLINTEYLIFIIFWILEEDMERTLSVLIHSVHVRSTVEQSEDLVVFGNL